MKYDMSNKLKDINMYVFGNFNCDVVFSDSNSNKKHRTFTFIFKDKNEKPKYRLYINNLDTLYYTSLYDELRYWKNKYG